MLEQKRGGWRGLRQAQTWLRSLETYTFPRIGGRPVSEVNTADVLEILTPIWHAKAETARAVRQRIRAVLEWAIAIDLRNDNPCDRVLPVLGTQNDIVQHRLALRHKDVAAVVETVRASAAPAIKLGVRVSRADGGAFWRGATGDVGRDRHGRPRADDFRCADEAEARAPGPAGRRALEILDAARTLGEGTRRLVFPMRSGKPISASTLPKMLQYHRIAAVAHGFLSSFRDWAAEETDHPRERVVENKVEAAYARSDLFERRRLMDDGASAHGNP